MPISSKVEKNQTLLDFFRHIHQLKATKRTGWLHKGITDCESIADHMYRMAMMCMVMEVPEGVNRERCISMSLVHDLAEAIVGDITPVCGVSDEEKHRLERVHTFPNSSLYIMHHHFRKPCMKCASHLVNGANTSASYGTSMRQG